MTDYEVVIGLEVHAQLLTRSKMFCGCPPTTSAPSRTRTRARCASACPGVLPTINGQAVRLHGADRAGAPLRHPRFHQVRPQELLLSGPAEGLPDLAVRPAASRSTAISSFRSNGETRPRAASRASTSRRTRARCSTPATCCRARRRRSSTSTAAASRSWRSSASRICARREEAREYLVQLRQILRYIGVNDGNMEEGSFRCDANVSLRPRGETELGVKVEVKNMNSFRAVQRALESEIERQTAVLDARRHARAGDARLGGGAGAHHLAAQQGAGARLPLLPRARPAAAAPRQRVRGARARDAPGAAGGARRALPVAVRAHRVRRRGAHRHARERRHLRGTRGRRCSCQACRELAERRRRSARQRAPLAAAAERPRHRRARERCSVSSTAAPSTAPPRRSCSWSCTSPAATPRRSCASAGSPR